jgi:hypothetical protein
LRRNKPLDRTARQSQTAFALDALSGQRRIHVERDDSNAKSWLDTVRLGRSIGFSGAELNKIQKLVVEHVDSMRRSWDEYFGR